MKKEELDKKLNEVWDSLPADRKQRALWEIVKLCFVALFRPKLFKKYYPSRDTEPGEKKV